MKKFGGIISLIILILTEIITPFSYAMEDDFLDVQEIVEETNDLGEEVIEGTEENLEGDSDADLEGNEENIEENEDEVDEGSLEGVIEEETIEDGNNEDISNEDGLSEIENQEKIDYKKYTKESRVAVLAEKIGIDWEAEKEYYAELAGVEGEYKGTRSQNEIIRVYFVEHIEELVEKHSKGDLLKFAPETELTGGVNLEIDVFSGTSEIQFNSREITGSKTIDDVTVNVLAPIGSFYSGTNLVIQPVKTKILNEIKNQLVEEQDKVTEDSTVIAFDISFMYSGEEVQPISGTVQVSFNYETNDELKQAEKDESQEVQVYHINDKNKEGNTTVNKEIEKVDIVESNEGEIVVEAESFSIYTIVTQVAEEGPKAETEDQLANFVYGEISIERPAILSEEDYPIEGFTIMDRNLGAKSNEISTVGSYGYHYQWGNNYGFSMGCWSSSCSDSITSLSKSISLFGAKFDDTMNNSGYYGTTFLKCTNSSSNDCDYWEQGNTHYHGLWGGAGDVNYSNTKGPTGLYWDDGNDRRLRQGPCPEGWHVPSAGEFSMLLYYRYNSGVSTIQTPSISNNLYKFSNTAKLGQLSKDLKIPLAGDRNREAKIEALGTYAYLWSSSPSLEDKISWNFQLRKSDGFVDSDSGYRRARGLSVRCFKNTYSGTGDTFKITYDFNGGSGSVVNQMVKSGDLAERPTDPIKSGYNFIGWYVSGINQLFDFSKSVSEDKELFAKYKQICLEGFVDDGEQCIDENNVAYLKNGQNFKLVLTTLADGNPINYIKKTDNIIPDSTSTGNLSLSGLPVIAWYTLTEDGTGIIYYKTEASTIFMNGDSSNMFRDLSKLKEIDLSNFNTKNVTRMDGMFRECSNLVEIDLSNFNTKNVTRMDGMFYNCRSLTSLDVSKFDTSNVRDMSRIFSNCRSLTSLDVSKFDTSNVTNMRYMFNYCDSLTSLDMSKFDTSNVTNMSYMFSYMSLETIDVSKFDTSNVTNMGKMFEGNSKLTMIDVSNWDTSMVTDMNSMFQQTGKLKTIYVSDKFSTQLVSKSNNMFRASSNLIGGNGTKYNSSHLDATYAHIDTGDNPGYFTNPNSFTVRYLSGNEVVANLTGSLGGNAPKIPRDGKYYTYYSDSNKTIPYDFNQPLSGYTVIYVDWVELKANIKVGQTFNDIIKGIANNNKSNIYRFERSDSITDEIKSSATEIQTDDSESKIYAWFDSDVNSGTVYYYSDAKTIYLKGNASNMFSWFGNLNYVDISNFNTEDVTNMSSMFSHTKITSLDLSHFDTSNVTNMTEMFGGSPIASLDISSFNTENVTSMGAMFEQIKVTSLDISHFDTSKVEYMNRMFNGCSELTTLILGDNFDTSNVKNMERMFSGCSKLVSLDLSGFNTENVTNMSSMFSRCGKLENVNVSSFDTSNVTNMGNMFSHTKISELDLSHFDTSNVTNMGEMFEDTLISLLDISSFNTEKVTTMSAMFEGIKVSSLDLSRFDTSNVESMNRMFNGCKELTTLNLGDNFDTSKVTNMEKMFANSPKLEVLDLSSFNTSEVTNMSIMFEASSNLKYIYVSDKFSTGSLLDSRGMFNNTSKLIGGNGTKWSSGNITGTYAKIDNEYQSGYFTDPSHFKVNFISTTGVIIDSQWLSGGDTITPLEDNTKDFIYYKTYTDSTNNELFDTGTKLYAYIEIIVGAKDKYKVEFDTMGGSPLVEIQRVSEGGTATGIEESLLPHKKKHTFEGWYENEEGIGEPFNFATEITEDKILYAKWKEKLCVTYSVNGNNITITGLEDDEDCKEDLVIPNKIEEKWVKTISNMAFQNKGLSGTLTFQTPSEITYIGYSAFRENNLTGNLILPEGLTSIQNHTFYGNNFNGELEIPSGVTSIGETSFYKNKFSGITLNEGLQSIGYGAFDNMGTLQGNLKIPSTVTSIASTAFNRAFDINFSNNTLELGNNVTSIGYGAFRNNNISGSLILPEGLTTIQNHTFYGNKFYGNLYIPSGIKSIGETAFYNNKLSKVIFYTGGTINIGVDAFCNNSGTVKGYRNGAILNPANPSCMSLEDYLQLKVTFDSQVEGSGTWELLVNYGDILKDPIVISGDNVLKWYQEGSDTEFDFENTSITEPMTLYGRREEYGVENVCFKTTNLGNGKIRITGFKNDAPDECKINTVIPDRILGAGWVTEIGSTAFYNIESLSGELKISNTVENIFPGAFRNSFNKTAINTLKLGTGLKDIQYNAFMDCGLTGELILPESIVSIGRYAFEGNNFNGILKIPSLITSISPYSFQGNSFVGIDFSDAEVTEILEGAFYYMKSLVGEFKVPDTIITIGPGAFREAFDKNGENTLLIGNHVRDIQYNAFQDSGLTGTLLIPESVTNIGKNAFSNNNFIGDLIIPESVTTVGQSAFRGNNFNGLLKLSSKLTTIEESAFRENKIKKIDFNGAKLTSIGYTAFYNNQTLSGELKIPDTVEVIGPGAFRGVFNKSTNNTLILGTGIKDIQYNAFMENNIIGDIIFPENIESIGNDGFSSNKIDSIFFQTSGNISIGWNAFCSNGTVLGYQNLANISAETPDCVTWQGKYPYNVSYVTYGGEPSDDETVLYGDSITNTSPIKTGYDFKGWYLTGDISFNNDIPITGDLTLYALFQKDIVFKLVGNGNKLLSGTEELDNYVITGTVFNNDYEYQFAFPGIKENDDTPIIIGYSTGVDVYTPSYQPGDAITLTGSKTFYAQTKETYNKHKGSFISGTGVDSLGEAYQQQVNIYCTPAPTYNGNRNDSCTIHSPIINLKSGYNSAKYYRGSNIYNQDTDILISNDQTFTAIGDLLTYNITYILNAGYLDNSKTTYTTEEGFNVSNPIRTGYEFNGWTGTNIINPTKNLEINTGTYGDLTLYANWIPNIYTILFTYSGNEIQQTINYDEEIELNENTFEKEGYTFSGWYDEENDTRYLDKQKIKNLTSNSGTVFTLTAEWNPNTYTIVFHSNTGDDEILSQSFTYNEGEKSLAKNMFINTGYVFKGWNTEKLGTGITYQDEQEVSNLTSVNNTTINLYAQWNRLINISFKDGDMVLSGYSIESGETIVSPDNPIKNGYTFSGWIGLPEDMIAGENDLEILADWNKAKDNDEPQQASAGGGRVIKGRANEQEHNSANEQVTTQAQEEKELDDLYIWAHNNRITTLPTRKQANLDGEVIRGHLAKMLVNYELYVEGKELPKEIPEYCKWNDSYTEWESEEIKDYAEKACALGIMGINMNKFLPNEKVTRAQFGTVLSRILWGSLYNTKNNENIPYYKKHLKALKENKIMEITDNPEKFIEIRKRVWLMLRRTKEIEK